MATREPEVIRDLSAFAALEIEWNALVEGMEAPEVFHRWEWNYYFFLRFGKADELFVVVTRDASGALIGVAPLCIRRKRSLGLGIRVLGSIIVDIGDYRNFIVHPAVRRNSVVAQIFELIESRQREWDVMDVAQLSTRDPTTFHLVERAHANREWTVRVEYLTPVAMRLPHHRESVERRRRVRTYSRAAHQKGFRVYVGQQITDELWFAFRDLHRAVWPNSAFKTDSGRLFFEDLRMSPGLRGKLEFSFVEQEGRALAFHFGFVDFGTVYYYMPVLDQEQAQHRLGAILLHSIVEHYSGSHERVDFLRGLEPYKLWYTDHLDANLRVVVSPNASIRAFAYNFGELTRKYLAYLGLPRALLQSLRRLISRSK